MQTVEFVYNFLSKQLLNDCPSFLAAELSNAAYWRNSFLPFTGTKQLAEFTVIDVELNRDTIKNKV